MRGTYAILGVIALVAIGGPLQAAERCEAAAVLAAAERAQGGPIRTLKINGSGSDFVVGQGVHPAGPWPRFNLERYERAMDFDALASSLVTVRSQALNPPRGGARQPLDRTETPTAVAPGSPGAKALRRELALLFPAGFLAAAAHLGKVSATSLGGGCALTVPMEEGAPITAEFSSDGHVKRITSKVADDVLGDAPVETRFTGTLSAGERSLPARVEQKVGGHLVLDLRLTSATVLEEVHVAADLAAPLADWMAPPRMPSEQLGEGTFVMPARYSALAVDLGDYIVLIESPQSEARASEVIAETHRLIPGKPIRYVVNTHAHFDHTAGLRTAAAEGATIITHKSNVRFLQDVLNRPRTLRPDTLARAPREIRFLPVDERFSLSGAGREIQLYHLKGVDHVDGMLVVYLPQTKVLVEADVFTPPAKRRTDAPAAINPYNVQLLRNVQRLGLDVDRLISIHYAADGRRVGMDELRLAAGEPNAEQHRP